MHRLPVRDELLDTLGSVIALRTVSEEEWEDLDLGAEAGPLKRGRRLCHVGDVHLPRLQYQDTSDINREGITIILIEPLLLNHGALGENEVDYTPRFSLPVQLE